MAFQSVTDAGRKFGNKFRQKKFDSYHGGDQPEAESTPKHHDGDKVNLEGADKHVENKHAQHTGEPDKPKESQEQRGEPAHVHYAHDHISNNHTVTKTYGDGKQTSTSHPSAAEAYEAGGEQQATDVKKRNHPDQQGAESEEANYEMPDLTI
jgi:hypothetical protein